MFYLAAAVVVSGLLIPNKSLGASGASNPPTAFSTDECEVYLSGEQGRELVRRGEEWLRGLPAKRYMTPRRVEIKDGAPLDPEILNPKVVWFTSGPDESYERVRERFDSAREKADQFYLQQVRTMQTGLEDETEAETEQAALSTIEKAALGIPSNVDVNLNDVRVRIIPPRPRALRLNVQVDGRAMADLALPLSSLRPGFRDNIALWLASQLKSDEVPVALPTTATEEDKGASIASFLQEHGQFGLFRKANGQTFAYVFSMQYLNENPREPEGFTLDIYSAMPCLHRQMMKGELDFPLMRVNQTYLCLSDTFIKLQVPFGSAPDVERPAGWTERQFQL